MRAHWLGKDSGVSHSLHGTGYSAQHSAPQLWGALGAQDWAKWRLQLVLMRCLATSSCGDGLHTTWMRRWLNSPGDPWFHPEGLPWAFQQTVLQLEHPAEQLKVHRAPHLAPPALPPRESPARWGLGPYRLGLDSVKSLPRCTNNLLQRWRTLSKQKAWYGTLVQSFSKGEGRKSYLALVL